MCGGQGGGRERGEKGRVSGEAVQVCVCVEVRRAGGGRERGGRVSGEAVQVCVAVRGAGGRGERRGG